MQNNIDNLLEELYQSDPSLRQHSEVLRKLVVELMASKPNSEIDEGFRQELRRRIMALAETKQQKLSLTNIFMKRFQMVSASVAVLALLVVSAWYLNDVRTKSPSGFTSMLSSPNITKTGSNAFGQLNNLQAGGRGQSGGGNGSESATLAVAPTSDVAVGSGGGSGVDAKMIAPAPYNVKYVYKGDELALINTQLDVLKRVKGANANNLQDFINSASLGLVNLGSFDNAKLYSFSFAEDRELGYMVNVSFSEGSVNINENWEKWTSIYPPCYGTMIGGDAVSGCEPKRLEPSDIPADQVLIDAANAFLNDHGIPLTAYGQPIVNSDWRVHYERTTDPANYWVPEVLNVIYPLVINGQQVFDEVGNPVGLNVSVRVSPDVRVSSVWELTSQNYESSSYEAETDVKRIMGLVELGGFRNYYYMEPNAKTVEAEVGTPEVSFVKLWNYRDNKNEEILVPALIFPITKQPEGVDQYYWYKKSIVVPLVKEILDNENNNGGGSIRPLIEPAVDTVAPAPAQ